MSYFSQIGDVLYGHSNKQKVSYFPLRGVY